MMWCVPPVPYAVPPDRHGQQPALPLRVVLQAPDQHRGVTGPSHDHGALHVTYCTVTSHTVTSLSLSRSLSPALSHHVTCFTVLSRHILSCHILSRHYHCHDHRALNRHVTCCTVLSCHILSRHYHCHDHRALHSHVTCCTVLSCNLLSRHYHCHNHRALHRQVTCCTVLSRHILSILYHCHATITVTITEPCTVTSRNVTDTSLLAL